MKNSDATDEKYQVVCVCGGYGFPLGTASAARILMVGKALQEGGIPFHVLHCGPTPVAVNKQKSGVYEGISFQYTTWLKRPKNKFIRLLTYAWAMAGLTIQLARLRPVRGSTLIYLYVMDGSLNLYTGALCQLLGLSVMQEFCEWFPSRPNFSRLNSWLYRKRIFKAATGALVISRAIEARVIERCKETNCEMILHRAGVMVDSQRFASGVAQSSGNALPSFMWCGSWLEDVFFLIRAFKLVRLQGYECRLTIIGECKERSGREVLEYVRQQGLLSTDVVLIGCVERDLLAGYYKTATALLMPLWKDDASITRIPNKMGEYLAVGRPVITSAIGDSTDFLTDSVNAYVGEPGNERAFADKMIEVLEDRARAERIGAAGQQTCFDHLDFRSQSEGLSDFVARCIRNRRRSTRRNSRQMHPVSMAPVQVKPIPEECSADANLH